ncbi:hypothetical protein MMC20_007405 [Loxospora ochrophaea]|nr:hypothetical protein [Loxospora ochrophaea]
MPRGAKKNANQHNNRHENGIVAPGKRISKQKSNGHLSANPEASSKANTPPLTPLSPAGSDGSYVHAKSGFGGAPRVEEGKGRCAAESSEESEPAPNRAAFSHEMLERNTRKIDVNSAKNPAVHDNSGVRLALTILRSCPLGDTIAILIFLMSLPPTFLTITNTLFALLTLMPSVGSLSSLPTLSEITLGSAGATSLSTICLIDVIGFLLWLVMFTPVQALAIDLTQAVVATTLGGGYSSRKGRSDNTLLCMFIVSATHLARYKDALRQMLAHFSLVESLSDSVTSPDIASPLADDIGSARSYLNWARVLIALHILIQGLARMVRHWYLKRDYAEAASISKKSDHEAVAGSQAAPESLAGSSEETFNKSTSSSFEFTSKSSLPGFREARNKISGGKKKKKQGTYVRSQQPLWAAFAATKVTILREYEQSQATSEAVGSKATDVKNLGSAPFVLENGRIWVTQVRPSSFRFDTSYFPTKGLQEQDCEELATGESVGIDRSKPFFVRINGADWASTKIRPVFNDETKQDSAGQSWTGEVFGLSSSCSYHCTFVRSEDDVVIHAAEISTPFSPATDQGRTTHIDLTICKLTVLAAPMITTPSHQTLRPSSPTSPTTTLKNSITAFEASLGDSYIRQKRVRNDNKASSVAIKRESEKISRAIAKVEGDDQSYRNRHIQYNQQARQADEAVNSISGEVSSLENIPDDESQDWDRRKSNWEDQRSKSIAAREDLFSSKECTHRDASAVRSESITALQKRERLQSRTTKLSEQHERLESATMQGLNEKERKEAEQLAKDLERKQSDFIHKDQVASISRSVQDLQYRGRQAWQQAQALEFTYEQFMLSDAPVTPEGELPGTVPNTSTSTAFRFPNFGSPNLASNTSNPALHHHDDGRGRSTSVLSGNSVYTDFSDADPAPPMLTRIAAGGRVERRQSRSSGSEGSPNDPLSPALGCGGRRKVSSPLGMPNYF